MNRLVATLAVSALLAGCAGPSTPGGGDTTSVGCAIAGCPAGQACNGSSDRCEALPTCASGCPAGMTCNGSTGLCVAESCTVDSTCGAGQFCIDGLCTGCATGSVQCLSGVPVCSGREDTCGPCATNADCPAEAAVCDDGHCAQCSASVACPAGRGSCTWDGRCAANQCDDLSPCSSGGACSPSGLCRTACTTDASCTAPAPHCVDVGWDGFDRCVACLADAECTTGQRCVAGDCAVPLPGDFCDAPLPIDLSSGETWFVTDLDGYRTECGLTSCGNPDVFLAMTIVDESFVDVAAKGFGIFPAVDVEILSSCGHVVATATGKTSSSATIAGRILQPGTWLIRLAADPYSQSRTTLHVKLTPLPTGLGESCSRPTPLVPSAAGAISSFRSLVGHAQPSPDSCDYADVGYPETVYLLDLAAPSRVYLKVTPSSSNLWVGLSVKTDCAAEATESYPMCPGDYGRNWQEWTYDPLPAGRHYIVVTSEGTPGSYVLTGTVIPIPPNDLCANAELLGFDVTGAATTTGQTRAAGYEDFSTCSACPPTGPCYQGRDVYYRFSTAGNGERVLDVTATATGTTPWPPRLVLSRTCAIAATDVACAAAEAGQRATLSIGVLPEGDYVLQVGRDGGPSEPGVDFSLSATLGPPRHPVPENDVCPPPASSTFTLTAVGSSVTLSGDTRGANDSIGGTCAGAGGNDTVYRVSLPLTPAPPYGYPPYGGRVEVTVHPITPTFNPAVVGDESCATVSGACGHSAGAGEDEVFALALPSTGYFWVEGAGATAGAYTVKAKLLEQSPINDYCALPYSLPIDGSQSGDLAAASPDVTCLGVEGPSLWYTVYNATKPAKTRRITVTPSGFDAAIALFPLQPYRNCADACSQLVNAAGVDGTESVVVDVPDGQEVSFAVLGVGGGRGAFTMTSAAP